LLIQINVRACGSATLDRRMIAEFQVQSGHSRQRLGFDVGRYQKRPTATTYSSVAGLVVLLRAVD
jgi:hypothetical protein